MFSPGGGSGLKRASVLAALHVLLLLYSLSGFFSKNASSEPVFSPRFLALYSGMLLILFVYAIGWQQIIKRLPLTLAFANKAVTVVWGMIWGILFFGEGINALNVIGAVLVVSGVVLFAMSDDATDSASSFERSDFPEKGA